MLRSFKGQTVLPEYVVLFFLAIAAVLGMSLFVQRGLQGRLRDAREYMLDMAAQGCLEADMQSNAVGVSLDCQGAGRLKNARLAPEYEPYYGRVASTIHADQNDDETLNGDGIFRKQFSRYTDADSTSEQLPPWGAD